MRGHVLFVDDDVAMTSMVEQGLSRRGFVVDVANSGDEAFQYLAEHDVDVVITDLRMPKMSGIELGKRITASYAGIPVIVLTAFGSMDAAVAAIRAGAYDFVTKPVELDTLALAVERAVRHRSLTQEVVRLRRRAAGGRGGALIGESAAMRDVYDMIDRVAETDASVLVTGESGTGKELVAREIHRRSARHEARMVTVNCAAMPESLLESELFGHVKGAFTDAKTTHEGLFVTAHKGTLFLDEIGEMPLTLQPKLLRALQERKVRPIGSNHEVSFDVRLITATNRDLEAAVAEHRFREDLFYRIDVVRIHLPPLRARDGDVMLLAQAFLSEAANRLGKPVRGFSKEAADRLVSYDWPGNVRELANAIERAIVLARSDEIVAEDLPTKIRDYIPPQVSHGGTDPSALEPLDEVERRYIQHVLKACGGNQSMAAQVLKIDRKTLARRLRDRL
jgi:two-component system response regulator AtoC